MKRQFAVDSPTQERVIPLGQEEFAPRPPVVVPRPRGVESEDLGAVAEEAGEIAKTGKPAAEDWPDALLEEPAAQLEAGDERRLSRDRPAPARPPSGP